jgi:hypothetical protein
MQTTAVLLPKSATTDRQADNLKQYSQINTSKVLDALSSEGFLVRKAMVRGSRTRDPELARHTIIARHEQYSSVPVNGLVPEVVIINSHDGTSAFRIQAGLFRLVCSNGLVVPQSHFASDRIYHRSVTMETVIEKSLAVIQKASEAAKATELMANVTLDKARQLEFAKLTLENVWQRDGLPPELLLNRRRPEDQKDDLFTVFNVIQENLMRGGLSYTRANGRHSTTHGIRTMDNELLMNQRLWKLAETFTE